MARTATKEQQAYMNQYNKQAYDRVNLMLPKGQKANLQAIAKDHGISLNELYARAIREWCKGKGIDF